MWCARARADRRSDRRGAAGSRSDGAARVRAPANEACRGCAASEGTRSRNFGQKPVLQRVQRRRSSSARARPVIGKRRVDAARASSAAIMRHVGGRRVHDQAYLPLCGGHVRQRLHVEDLVGEGRHLVGRHHPRADARSSVSWCASATARSRQRGIGRTRRGGSSTSSTADGSALTPWPRRRLSEPSDRAQSSPAPARGALWCRWRDGRGPDRPSRGYSGARDLPEGRRRPRAVPVALASRQVTPPVECTSTSAAASSSGIRSVNP